MTTTEIEREQEYLRRLYERVDLLRAQAADRLAGALRQPGGAGQARVERDVAAARYAERVARLDAAEHGLCFGRIDLFDGERRHIGRIGLLDESAEGEPLLLDWRAPAARPFYVATARDPHGVRRRRHIATRGRRVVGVDDEVLDRADLAELADADELTGEAALLAAVEAGRTGRMRDIVATLQAEQDEIIRSPHRGILVVQGGPGTGKTAVALHRAAYLLYTHRRLAERGVLVVGPNATFLTYIGQVLPGLGETNVVLATVAELYPGVTADRHETETTAEIKGRAAMADVLAAAVRDRQAPGPLEVKFAGDTLRLDHETLQAAAERARASRLPHNQARPAFRREVLDLLAEQATDLTRRLTDRLTAEVADVLAASEAAIEADLANLPEAVYEEEPDDPRPELLADPAVRAAVEKQWPALTPERLLADLYADPARLASAAPELTTAERAALRREPGGWSAADVPLLDEAAELLGRDDRADEARAARDRDRQVAYAQGVLDIAAGSADEGEEETLRAADLLDAGLLADRHRERDRRTVAERAAADRTWAFGHVIVDEAQELSEMAWRLLVRRCPSRSMTIVGDVAQTGSAAGTTSWARALAPHAGDRWRQARLSVNYRTPAEIMAVTADLLAAVDPELAPPRSVRSTGVPPWRRATGDLPGALAAAAAAEIAPDRRLALIVPERRIEELGAAVARRVPVAYGDSPDLTSPVVLLGVRQAKGLEFDSVLIADPAAILAESPRGRSDLYVAMTRSTQRLGVLHLGAPPREIAAVPPR